MKESKRSSTEASLPTARYKAKFNKTDIRIQQKDCTATSREETSFSRRYVSQSKFKSVGLSREQCKRDASRIRRVVAFDRSVNDVAKDVKNIR